MFILRCEPDQQGGIRFCVRSRYMILFEHDFFTKLLTPWWIMYRGLVMLVRGSLHGVLGKADIAAGPEAIPVVSLSTLLLDGFLLLICP